MHQRQLFGKVIDLRGAATMQLNDVGQIVHDLWMMIPEHFPHVKLDQLQIMPDHLHAILVLRPRIDRSEIQGNKDTIGTAGPTARPKGPAKRSLGAILGVFKSEATKRINSLLGTPGQRIWLHGFHDHQIRTTMGEYGPISKYIEENPSKWARKHAR